MPFRILYLLSFLIVVLCLPVNAQQTATVSPSSVFDTFEPEGQTWSVKIKARVSPQAPQLSKPMYLQSSLSAQGLQPGQTADLERYTRLWSREEGGGTTEIFARTEKVHISGDHPNALDEIVWTPAKAGHYVWFCSVGPMGEAPTLTWGRSSQEFNIKEITVDIKPTAPQKGEVGRPMNLQVTYTANGLVPTQQIDLSGSEHVFPTTNPGGPAFQRNETLHFSSDKPSISEIVSFTPNKPGEYVWNCAVGPSGASYSPAWDNMSADFTVEEAKTPPVKITPSVNPSKGQVGRPMQLQVTYSVDGLATNQKFDFSTSDHVFPSGAAGPIFQNNQTLLFTSDKPSVSQTFPFTPNQSGNYVWDCAVGPTGSTYSPQWQSNSVSFSAEENKGPTFTITPSAPAHWPVGKPMQLQVTYTAQGLAPHAMIDRGENVNVLTSGTTSSPPLFHTAETLLFTDTKPTIVRTFPFTPTKEGDYLWTCSLGPNGANTGWRQQYVKFTVDGPNGPKVWVRQPLIIYKKWDNYFSRGGQISLIGNQFISRQKLTNAVFWSTPPATLQDGQTVTLRLGCTHNIPPVIDRNCNRQFQDESRVDAFWRLNCDPIIAGGDSGGSRPGAGYPYNGQVVFEYGSPVGCEYPSKTSDVYTFTFGNKLGFWSQSGMPGDPHYYNAPYIALQIGGEYQETLFTWVYKQQQKTDAPSNNMNGNWTSTDGPVTVTQDGDTLEWKNGTYSYTGTLQGNTINYAFVNTANGSVGQGTMNAVSDHSFAGTYSLIGSNAPPTPYSLSR